MNLHGQSQVLFVFAVVIVSLVVSFIGRGLTGQTLSVRKGLVNLYTFRIAVSAHYKK